VQKGAKFIAVVTNDSWYGKSSGPYQHKEISVLRAIENRRTVVRAANGGISCIINPMGITLSETELFTRTQLTGDISINNELTFYTKNPLLIPFISLSISLLVLILYFSFRLRENFKLRKFKKMSL
jgi:apolipoprotein N-acyltransferase